MIYFSGKVDDACGECDGDGTSCGAKVSYIEPQIAPSGPRVVRLYKLVASSYWPIFHRQVLLSHQIKTTYTWYIYIYIFINHFSYQMFHAIAVTPGVGKCTLT